MPISPLKEYLFSPSFLKGGGLISDSPIKKKTTVRHRFNKNNIVILFNGCSDSHVPLFTFPLYILFCGIIHRYDKTKIKKDKFAIKFT